VIESGRGALYRLFRCPGLRSHPGGALGQELSYSSPRTTALHSFGSRPRPTIAQARGAASTRRSASAETSQSLTVPSAPPAASHDRSWGNLSAAIGDVAAGIAAPRARGGSLSPNSVRQRGGSTRGRALRRGCPSSRLRPRPAWSPRVQALLPSSGRHPTDGDARWGSAQGRSSPSEWRSFRRTCIRTLARAPGSTVS
jgi:hypothetical protein